MIILYRPQIDENSSAGDLENFLKEQAEKGRFLGGAEMSKPMLKAAEASSKQREREPTSSMEEDEELCKMAQGMGVQVCPAVLDGKLCVRCSPKLN